MEKDDILFLIIMVTLIISALLFHLSPDDKKSARNRTRTTVTTSNEQSATQGDLNRQIEDIDSEIKELSEEIRQAQIDATRSPYYDKVNISTLYTPRLFEGAREETASPSDEYIRLNISYFDGEKIPMTGWTIRSTRSGNQIQIGYGAEKLRLPGVNTLSPVYLESGTSITINTGSSPIGHSFRVNKCSGYFAKSYDFKPSISSSCPSPDDELIPLPYNLQTAGCFNYINKMPSCVSRSSISLPQYPATCQNFIRERFTYNGCVDAHQYEKDFYKKEWRLFVGKNEYLWRGNGEILELYDQNGKIVDTYEN